MHQLYNRTRNRNRVSSTGNERKSSPTALDSSMMRLALESPESLEVEQVASVEALYGNRAAGDLTRQGASPNSHGLGQLPIQPKLTVGPTVDNYEREADAVASNVVRTLQSQSPADANISVAQRNDAKKDESLLRAKSLSNAIRRMSLVEGGPVSTDVERTIQRSRGRGHSLDEEVRSSMESAFGADFRGVKIHTDAQSDSLNRSLSARAFTSGQDVFFRRGEYNPSSTEGKKLIAHELTHVVQQNAAPKQVAQRAKYDASSFGQSISSYQTDALHLQRKSVPGVANYGNFADLGNGKFGTTKPTNATEVTGLVNAIRTKAAEAGEHQNIKILTGTHGDKSGNLVGEEIFYREDTVHEGHQVDEGGWINVLNVQRHSKDTLSGWKEPGSSAVILAWCYSKASDDNWENVHCYKNGADYQAGKQVW